MTQEEQKRIIRTLETYGEPEAIAYSQRIEKWALETFSRDGHTPELRARGIHVDYRAVTDEAWYLLKDIPFTRFSWETNDDTRTRKEAVQNLFYWQNNESSNQMGDVVEVRLMPYIDVDGQYRYKEDEAKSFDCTDTGKRRKWNQLDLRIYGSTGGGVRDYDIIRPDMHRGDDICWYQSWHFSLGDDVPCPVGPILVEEIDDYHLVLRYGDKLFPLSMELGRQRSAHLIEDQPVKPTHNWDSRWLRPPYSFTLVADLSWKKELYPSTDREQLQHKPHFVRTSDLPPGVRTREQIDHDAWEEAVRSGALNNRR